MKKAIAILLTMATVMGSSLTVFAAPETMQDGTVFDAEYYAQAYPDVAAALGTDRDVLYNHYVTFGKAEGRSAYAADVQQPVNVTVPSATKIGTTPTDVLVILDYYPEFMLTDSRPRCKNFTIYGYNKEPIEVLINYDYDIYGNLVAEKCQNPNIHLMYDRDYTVDAEGRIIKRSGGLYGLVEQDFIYDEQGRLTGVNSAVRLEYNEQGVLTKITTNYNNGNSDLEAVSYNEQGYPLCIYDINNAAYKTDYVYDAQGKLTKKSTVSSIGAYTVTYKYDTLGRLVEEVSDSGTTYHYSY